MTTAMKCGNCKAEWTSRNDGHKQIFACPFCGKTLIEKDEEFSTLEDILKTIVSHNGVNGLRDGKKTLSMLMDLSPGLKREHKMFLYFIQNNGNELLLNALHASRAEQQVQRQKVVHNMMVNSLIEEKIAYEMCDAFWAAVGGKPFDSITTMDGSNIETYLEPEELDEEIIEVSASAKTPKIPFVLLSLATLICAVFFIYRFTNPFFPTAVELNGYVAPTIEVLNIDETLVEQEQMSSTHVNHNYSEATCTAPMACIECGFILSNALGHSFLEATCTSSKTCMRCGETVGSPLSHSWTQATCISQSFCQRCGTTSGSYGSHEWREATYDYPDTCIVCGQTRGTPKERPLSASLSNYETGSRIPNNQISVYASSCEPAGKYGTYYASNANDSNPKTEWAEGAYGSNAIGKGERLTFNFSRRSIAGFVIQAGMFRSQESFNRNCRPAMIRVYMDNTSPITVTLNDIMKNQIVLFSRPVNTSSISIELCTFYTNGVDPAKGLATCIADVWILQT